MFSPRDLELLQTVGEVMRERIGEVRGAYERELGELREKVAALEARPVPDIETAIGETRQFVREFTAEQLAAFPIKVDLTPVYAKIEAIEARPDITQAVDEARHNLDALHERVMALEGKPPPVMPEPPDLAPITTKIAELEQRPTSEEVLTLAQGALNSTQSALLETLEASLEKRFAALPIPEKGDPGPGVTADDFRPLFEAEYAKFALDTERRIMDLVQRTLDRIPVPTNGENGKDGVGIDDLNIVRDGRTVRHEYLREGAVVKSIEFKTDEMIYQGVAEAGRAYDAGDVVTWGGHIWVARADTTGTPRMDGGESGAWKLMVKEGRRGRSAYEVAQARGFTGTEDEWLVSLKGKPGKPGTPGKDLRYRMDGGVAT